MSKSDTKSRIINVYKILLNESDNEHYITIHQIINELEEMGITAYRKTIISDIEQLKEAGADIRCVKSTQNRYYMEKGIFSIAELKLLVDAVEASHFITRSKSAELIDKLGSLTSKYHNDELCREIYLSHRAKNENEEIFDVVDRCHEAINRKKQISFIYYDYDVNKEKVLHNNGERYVFSPYGMTWEDAKYYVIGFSEKHKKVVTFRVDRMGDVEISDKACVLAPEDFSITDFVNKVFRMYDDKTVTVTLKCKNELMKSVIDRFGTDVKTEPKKNGYFYAYVDVSAGQTFFG